MGLQYIFQGAALTVVHTGVVTGIAAGMGSDDPVAVGLTSSVIGFALKHS